MDGLFRHHILMETTAAMAGADIGHGKRVFVMIRPDNGTGTVPTTVPVLLPDRTLAATVRVFCCYRGENRPPLDGANLIGAVHEGRPKG
jgi:hypothetical protein